MIDAGWVAMWMSHYEGGIARMSHESAMSGRGYLVMSMSRSNQEGLAMGRG